MSLWIDASAGASGDMLLGALIGAGVPLAVLSESIDAVAPEPVVLRPEQVARNGFAATRCHVEIDDSVHHRSWRDIRALLESADLDTDVRDLAVRTFERLAVAEARVHGSDPLDVSFHEVGALDAIADVVGVCAGFAWLARTSSSGVGVTVSPVAVGSGTVRGAHGQMPVPPPAVAELLRGVPSLAGPGSAESCTPTGAALLTTLADEWGPQPAMAVDAIGVGAGGRDPETHANVLRLFVGVTPAQDDRPLLIESNIDDLDPRVWPSVIAALLDAGASDAWLTPILMKKGRPAHTLSVLTGSAAAEGVRAAIWRHTSTIGVREVPLAKHALDREMVSVDVAGQAIDVKLASHDGELVNAQPEWDDVARAAAALGRPVNDVLAEAIAATRDLLRTPGGPSPRSSD
jgi:uncharacterized protein (TIGR00299 family) protein